MKILISILLISSVGLFSDFSYFNPIQDSCSCQGATCSCSANCDGANCGCNENSCNCGCSSNSTEPDEDYKFLPTANDTQNENSIAIQGYFSGLETEVGTMISNYIETLRNAIADKDLKTYAKNAPLLNRTIENLPKSEKEAYKNWLRENLTPVND